MKRFKTTHFRILSMFVLIAGLTFTSCNDSSTSAIDEKEIELTTNESIDLMVNTQASNLIVIDDFTTGGGTWSACGIATFNFHEDASIAGGARELHVRDGWSCIFGGKPWINIDDAAGTAEWYSVGRTTPSHIFNYGTAIGTFGKGSRTDGRDAPSPNVGAGSELNLSLTLDDQIRLDLDQVYSEFIRIRLHDGTGITHDQNFPLVAGTNLIPLSDFTTMTYTRAADIDGVSFGGSVNSSDGPGSGNVFTSFSIELAVNDPSSKVECKKGGWEDFGFRNQGQCIRFVNTGKDSR